MLVSCIVVSSKQQNDPQKMGPQSRSRKMANKSLGFWNLASSVAALVASGFGIVKMPTGTGKTTQAPQLLAELGYTKRGVVLVSVPKRVLAIELARRVAEEMGVSLGGLVGYKIRGDVRCGRETRILFATEGMVRAMIRSNPSLEGISVILFDEFHQRSLMSDFNVALVERARQEGSECAALLMSATVDVTHLAEHFGCGVVDGSSLETTHPIEERYLDDDVNGDLYRIAAEKVREMVVNQNGNGIVFMPGKAEIDATIVEINRLNLPGVTVLPLHGGLDGDDRRAPFLEREGVTVTVATDIVETGATLPGIGWVVDSGLAKEVGYDPISDLSSLRARPIAQDRLKQRRGRCGRVMAGVYVGLFTSSDMLRRSAQTEPEIKRRPLREVVLTIKAMGLSRAGQPIRLIDSPAKTNWKTAKKQLQDLGLVATDEAAAITDRGEQAVELGCDPREAAMLLKASELGCLHEMAIAIAAQQSNKRLLYSPRDRQWEAEAAHAAFHRSKTCDAWTAVEVVRQFEQAKGCGMSMGAWCREKFVSFVALQDVLLVANQLERSVHGVGLTLNRQPGTELQLRQAIIAGLPDRIFREGYRNRYSPLGDGESLTLGRESVVKSDELIAVWGAITIPTRRGELRLATNNVAVDTTPEFLLAALPPHVVTSERIDPRYEAACDGVTSVTRLTLNGQVISEGVRGVDREHPEAARVFAEYMTTAKDNQLPVLEDNRQQVARANELNRRAGEQVFETINLVDHYLAVCGGARNVGELTERISSLDALRLPAFDEELAKMVEDESPVTIELLGGQRTMEYRDNGSAPRVTLDGQQLAASALAELPNDGVTLPSGRLVEVKVTFGGWTTFTGTEIPKLKEEVFAHLNQRQWDAWGDKPAIGLPDPADDESVIPFATVVYGQCVVTGGSLVAYGTAGLHTNRYYSSDPYFRAQWFRSNTEAQHAANEAAVKLESLREEARVKRLAEQAAEEAEVARLAVAEFMNHPEWSWLDWSLRREVEGYRYGRVPYGIDECCLFVASCGEFSVRVEAALAEIIATREAEAKRKAEEEAERQRVEAEKADARKRFLVEFQGAVAKMSFFRETSGLDAESVASENGAWVSEEWISGSIWDWTHHFGAFDQVVCRCEATVVHTMFVASGRLEVLGYYESRRNDRPYFRLRWKWTGESPPASSTSTNEKKKKGAPTTAVVSMPPSEASMAALLGKFGKKR